MGDVGVGATMKLVVNSLVHSLNVTGSMAQAEASRGLVAEAVNVGMADRDISEVAEFLRKT
jgi:hypothetical protein